MRDQYMRTSQGFIIMYSITSRSSFEEVTSFIDQIHRVKDSNSVPIVIVGNKCLLIQFFGINLMTQMLGDLEEERQVMKLEGKDLAESFQVPFFEASAKRRINIEQQFFTAVRAIRDNVSQESTSGLKKKKPKGVKQT